MKAMKLRQVLHSGRATVAALAGTVMVIGGAGAGTAALALSHSAGALSLQAPAIAVKEQNVNAAGRIRVALPNGGVGVNGTVSVNNFPKTQPVTGTVNVGNLPTPQNSTTGNSQFTQDWNVPLTAGVTYTPLNLSGSGVFKGFQLTAYQDGNAGCVVAFVNIDGRNVFGEGLSEASLFGATSPIEGGTNAGNSGNNFMYFTPPGGFPFHASLNVNLVSNCGPPAPIGIRIWYTTNS